MFSPLFWTSAYDQVSRFFLSGDPPLYLKLLIINAVFITLFAGRRALMGYPLRAPASNIAQGLVLGVNVLLMTMDQLPQPVAGLLHNIPFL